MLADMLVDMLTSHLAIKLACFQVFNHSSKHVGQAAPVQVNMIAFMQVSMNTCQHVYMPTGKLSLTSSIKFVLPMLQ